MKKVLFIMMASLLTIVTNMFAQTTSSTTSIAASEVYTNGWNSIWGEWNPSTFVVDEKGSDNQSFTGFSLGFSHAVSLSRTSPLFMEVGLGGQYSFYEKEWYVEDSYESPYEGTVTFMSRRSRKLNMWSIKAPISLLYRYDIPNSVVSLMPYAGIDLRFNISGTQENYIGYKTLEYDVFDDGEMGGSDNTYNRFQLGWHIGVKANFLKHVMAGLSYGADFNEIAKKTKINTITIAVGYIF